MGRTLPNKGMEPTRDTARLMPGVRRLIVFLERIMVLLFSTLIIAIMSMAPAAFGQMRTETLLNACKEKTQVMKLVQGKPEVVGEKIAGLCHGYLVGVYDALAESKVICAPSDLPTPEYLYSVLQTYLKVEPSGSARPAVEVTQAAYQRAFACEEKRK